MKKIRIFTAFFLIFLYCLVHLPGQEISLEGRVTIHNSGTDLGVIQSGENVFISADFSSPTNTDNQGQFKLVFSEVLFGNSVSIKAEKAGWEIVNRRDLLDVTVGRIRPLRIYLAKEGAIAKARAELEKVSLEALTSRHQQLISQLQQDNATSQQIIRDLERKINRNISDRFEAERILHEQLLNTKKRLPELSLNLARVNLDFASELYRAAYRHFKNGEIEKTIEVLDEAILDKQATEAKERLLMARNQLSNLDTAGLYYKKELGRLIESTLLLAQTNYDSKDYHAASVTLQSAIKDLNFISSGNLKARSKLLIKAANWYQQNGAYLRSYYYYRWTFQEQGYGGSEKVDENPKWDGEIFLLQMLLDFFN